MGTNSSRSNLALHNHPTDVKGEDLSDENDSGFLLQQFNARKQPPPVKLANGATTAARASKSDQPSVKAATLAPASSSIVVDLLTDDESAPKNVAVPSTARMTSRYPPSSIVPGQTKPYVLPNGMTRCAFSHCHRYRHEFPNARKLKKHMVKRHKWPASILERSAPLPTASPRATSKSHPTSSPRLSANPRPASSSRSALQARRETPTGLGMSTLVGTLSTSPQAQRSWSTPQNTTTLEQPNRQDFAVEKVAETSRSDDDNQLSVAEGGRESDRKPRSSEFEIDLSDVPVVPGQTEPYTLPDGIRNCPLAGCNKHKFMFDQSWRVTEHMKRYHGWPRPSNIQKQWEIAKTPRPPDTVGVRGSATNDSAERAARADQAFTTGLQQSRKRSVNGDLKPPASGENYNVLGGPQDDIQFATTPSINTAKPQALQTGVSTILQSMVPKSTQLSSKTQELYDAIPDSVRHSKRLQTWIKEEENLLFHLKDEIGMKWRDLEPFFAYRGKWSVAQARYSIITRKRREAEKPDSPLTNLPNQLSHEPSTGGDELTPSEVVTDGARSSEVIADGARRSARTTHQTNDYRKYFRFRTQQDLDEGLEDPEVNNTETEHTSPYESLSQDSVEQIPQDREPASASRAQQEIERNDAAIGGLSPRICRSPALDGRKRRSFQIHKPYLSHSARRFLHASTEGDPWDASLAQAWDGQELHVDFTDAEATVVRQTILGRCPQYNRWQANQLGLDLSNASPADIDAIAHATTQNSRRNLQRTTDSTRGFISDVVKGQASTDRTVDRIKMQKKTPGQNQLARSLRHRELFGTAHDRSQLSNKSLGPQRVFKGTSSDVNNVAWSPNGHFFAVGSAALTDESSMQYNRPNNLLLGDYQHSQLLELPNHAKTRQASKGPNATHAMQASQDPLLFATISDVGFSSDSKVLFTAGYDEHIRLWEVGRYLQEPETDLDSTSNGLRCRWALPKTGEVDLVSAAPCTQDGPRLFAAATKTTSPKKSPIRLYSYCLDGADVIETCISRAALGPSPNGGLEETHGQLDTACLRFSPTFGVRGRYLLAGFIARNDAERRGEACLWDIETSTRVASLSRRMVFDIQWSPSVFGRFAIGCSSSPTANRGTATVVRLHDSRWLPNQKGMTTQPHPTIELECPAWDMNDVLFNPRDENIVAAGCTDGVVYLWDLRKPSSFLHRLGHGNSLHELDHTRTREESDTGIRFLSWDQSGRQLFSGSSDGVVACWNPYLAPQNSFERKVIQMNSGIMAGAFSPDYTNLLLGDVEGSVLMLGVGNDEVPLNECAPFDYVADESTKRSLREKYQKSDSHQDSDSGVQISNDLVRAGEIEIKPYGDFPRRQAVQGPKYEGPFDHGSDAQDLRCAAAASQARACATALPSEHNVRGVGPSSAERSAVAETFSDEPVGDEGLWKRRMPIQLHQPPIAQQAVLTSESGSCSRCFGKELKLPLSPEVFQTIRRMASADNILCSRCAASWRADVLGYQLVNVGLANYGTTPTQLGQSILTATQSRTTPSASNDDDEKTKLEPIETLDHYHDLWEIDHLLALTRRS